jgi:hypothetical protein
VAAAVLVAGPAAPARTTRRCCSARGRSRATSRAPPRWRARSAGSWRPSASTTSGTAADFIAAWRAVDWFPGDAYNWYNCRLGTNNPWNSLEKLLNPMRLFAQGHAIKGLMVPEYASTEDPAQPNRKAQWFTDARALFKKAGWEGFKAILYYNKSSKYPNCRWFVSSSQASLTAFRALAADVVYSRTEQP